MAHCRKVLCGQAAYYRWEGAIKKRQTAHHWRHEYAARIRTGITFLTLEKQKPAAQGHAGFVNVKDFSKTIFLAEAVGFVLRLETRMDAGLQPIQNSVYPFSYP
jgi:hypothetical protein